MEPRGLLDAKRVDWVSLSFLVPFQTIYIYIYIYGSK